MPRPWRILGTPSRFLALLLLPLAAACADRTPTAVAPARVSFDRGGMPDLSVAPGGSDTGDCTASPCATIGYAVAQASAGDVISVASGTYTESVMIDKSVTLVGHDATIDASGFDNGVVITGADAAGTVLTGFTVENAGLEGIFVLQTSRVTIAGNTLTGNDAYGPEAPQCVNQPDDCGEALHLQSVTNSMVRGNNVHDNIGGILLTDENGPTRGNTIMDNQVVNNVIDCGITLASHAFHLGGAVTPDVGGIYRNTIIHNTSNGNGAAGIGIFAGPPGAAAWGNTVAGNTAMNNGEGGVMIHSHTPGQYVDENVVTNNMLSGNGRDGDNPAADATEDISIFSAVVPIPHTVVSANQLSDAHYGIVIFNAVKVSGLKSNKFAGSIDVPIKMQ